MASNSLSGERATYKSCGHLRGGRTEVRGWVDLRVPKRRRVQGMRLVRTGAEHADVVLGDLGDEHHALRD